MCYVLGVSYQIAHLLSQMCQMCQLNWQCQLPVKMLSYKTTKGNTGGHVSRTTTVKLDGDVGQLISHARHLPLKMLR